MATIPDFNAACPFDNAAYRTHTFRNMAIVDPPIVAPPAGDSAPPRAQVEDIARTVYECGTLVRRITDGNGQPMTAPEQSDQCARQERPFLHAKVDELEAEIEVLKGAPPIVVAGAGGRP